MKVVDTSDFKVREDLRVRRFQAQTEYGQVLVWFAVQRRKPVWLLPWPKHWVTQATYSKNNDALLFALSIVNEE